MECLQGLAGDELNVEGDSKFETSCLPTRQIFQKK